MPGQLECPMSGTNIDADLLYYSRGEDNSSYRPVLTGDVYENLLLPGSTGTERNRTVIILQHPCSMRTNGVDLVWHILAAEVTKHKPLTPQEWAGGNFRLMPLPDLYPEVTSGKRDQAANFVNLYTLTPTQLESATRVASLSEFGINLLLQRWVHYSARVIVPTFQFQEATAGFCMEADLLEEWCEALSDGDSPQAIHEAGTECMTWLREDRGGYTYQGMPQDSQTRSAVRRAMRKEMKQRIHD